MLLVDSVRDAELISLVSSPDLLQPVRALLSHASPLVRQAAALAPVMRAERAIGPVLIEALSHAPLVDEGKRTFARLVELGTSDAVLAALASSVLSRPTPTDDRESWGSAISILARTDPNKLCELGERWLLQQISLSTATRSKPGLEYDGIAFDPDFRGPYLYTALAEVPLLPHSLAQLLTHISHGGFRRGYTAVFPLAARGDARALEWLGRALEWIPPGALCALGTAIVPYLVETLSRRHSGVAFAYAALEALDAANFEREKFVRETLDEARLAPPGHQLSRSIELLFAGARALSGDQIFGLLETRLRELDSAQLSRMFELLARTQDPRLEPYLVERARERDGTAMLFLAQLGGAEAERIVEALEEETNDRASHEAWCYLARHLPHPPRIVIDHALEKCRADELMSILARSGEHGVRAIMSELGALSGGGVSMRPKRLWDEVGPGELLRTLRMLAAKPDARAVLMSFTGAPEIRASLLAREALCDPPRAKEEAVRSARSDGPAELAGLSASVIAPIEDARPFSMEWARVYRARAALRRPAGSIFLSAGVRGEPARA